LYRSKAKNTKAKDQEEWGRKKQRAKEREREAKVKKKSKKSIRHSVKRRGGLYMRRLGKDGTDEKEKEKKEKKKKTTEGT
jgi:hypothetical protein